MNYGPKPAKFHKRLERELLKGFYKQQRYTDRVTGKKIDVLFQEFHVELKKEVKDRDTDKLKLIVKDISQLRSQKLFRQDFPTFAKFKKYLKKENLKLQDLLLNA